MAVIARLRRLVPLQPAGAALLGIALYLILRFAPEQIDHVAYAAGFAALALLGLCLILVIAATLALRARVRPLGITAEIDTHKSTATGLIFPTLARWPLVDLRLTWDTPKHVQVTLDGKGNETIFALERGRYPSIVRRFTIEDVFGLTALSFVTTSDAPVRIAPESATSEAPTTLGLASGGDYSHPAGQAEGDLIEMRQYAPGDPLRRVLWKSFARSRRLLVRMPEPAYAPQPASVGFLVAGVRDEVSAAVARCYLEQGYFGPDFRFSADGAAQPTRVVADAIEQIIDSASARARSGQGLLQLASQIEPSRLASCVVFGPATDGPWVAHLIDFARALPAPPTVIIGIDQAPQADRPRWLYYPEPSRAATTLRERLQAAGLTVTLVPRA